MNGPIRLVIPRADAERDLRTQLDKFQRLLESNPGDAGQLDALERDHRALREYATRLLRRIFDRPEFADKFEGKNKAVGVVISMPSPRRRPSLFHDDGPDRHDSLGEDQRRFHRSVQSDVGELASILQQLPLIDETHSDHRVGRGQRPQHGDRNVFVIHGHDEAAREAVARFLEKLGLEPIILHEQVSRGKTIIEKIEAHADVGFAVVLLTPDDEGRRKGEGHSLRSRARQNVMAELGYFVGRLGRDRVCALQRGDVEIPSDFDGVVYTDLDDRGAWKMELAKELKAAGMPGKFEKLLDA